MKTTHLLIAVIIFGLMLAGFVQADIVEVPLDCAGMYDVNNPYWQSDFDLGVTFSEISHVYIDWAGEITGGLAIDYSDPDNPYPEDVTVYASLGFNPGLRRTSIYGGEATYPSPEPFNELTEIPLPVNSTWSDLLDGTGAITVGYAGFIMTGGSYVESGSVLLTDAALVVDGMIIPELGTLLLLSVGILGVRFRPRKEKFTG